MTAASGNDIEPIVLASGSATRARLLAAAGVRHEAVTPEVDEQAVKDRLSRDGASPSDIAAALALAKAQAVARLRPDATVIGADQVLALGATLLGKPRSRAEARAQLRRLAGRTHSLHTAVVVVRGGKEAWRDIAVARLTMRGLSDGFLDEYLDAVGDAVLSSVGGYQIEGPGAQLFEAIEGDFFGILGLPLLPLLAYLRRAGMLRT